MEKENHSGEGVENIKRFKKQYNLERVEHECQITQEKGSCRGRMRRAGREGTGRGGNSSGMAQRLRKLK